MKVRYRRRVEALYLRFFRDMGIDPETGTTPLQTDWKFAAYPYIGSKYGADPYVKRLLVVGRDIGSDETPGRLQHFEERRQAIECTPLPSLNPHIAGTYFTALKYAFPRQEWDQIKDRDQTCQAILRDGYSLRSNPLSYIALTNFYKWVTVGRRNKGGAQDCTFVDPQLERGLFLEEVRLLAPHVVVFQGADFDKARFRQVRDAIPSEAEWHVLVHPSLRGSRRPKDLTHPRLSSTDPRADSLPASPAVADDLRTRVKQETEGYRGFLRDDASVLSLIALDGPNQEVWIHDVAHHARECGYEKHDIPFAVRWLKKHGKPVRGFVITSPRRGYYRLEKATKAQIAAWSTDMGEP